MDGEVATRIRVQDLTGRKVLRRRPRSRAQRETAARPALTAAAIGEFTLFESRRGPRRADTCRWAWQVDDSEGTVADLRGRGGAFEDADLQRPRLDRDREDDAPLD